MMRVTFYPLFSHLTSFPYDATIEDDTKQERNGSSNGRPDVNIYRITSANSE